MSLRVFVDTSAWLALVDSADQYHGSAMRKLDKIAGAGGELITTDYILDETITLVRLRISHSAAISFGENLLASSVVSMFDVSTELRLQAWELFKRYADKNLSFTDCTSFAVMHHLSLRKALTFDKHFRQCGLEMF